MAKRIKCPLCEAESLKYIPYGGTHIWTCEDCPAILFEYWSPSDLEGLTKFINR